MPIIVAILFGIGLLLIVDTSKLPWFLQIIRAGLVYCLRWALILGVVGGIIGLCMWGYNSYNDRKQLEAERVQWVADSTAWASRPMPEYATDEYREWEKYNTEKAKAYEAKLEQENEQYEYEQHQEAIRASELAQKQKQTYIFGSWGRVDSKFGSGENIGVYTFKRDKTFYTNSTDYQAEKGTYKVDYDNNTLYIYYDSGQSESINLADFTSDKMAGDHEQHEYTKVVFLKRPSIEREEVAEPEPQVVATVSDPSEPQFPDHSKDYSPKIEIPKPVRHH